MTALQVSTVLSCVNIISGAIASLPKNVYERLIRGGRLAKALAPEHQNFSLLHTEPNDEMTSFTWFKTMQAHALLWNNAYSEIQRDGAARPIALWPRNPARTRPVRLLKDTMIEGTLYKAGYMVYETHEALFDGGIPILDSDSPDTDYATRRIILPEDMIHIHGLSLDGRLGISTVWLSRQTMGLALATEKYGAKFFGNNARPAAVLEIPADMEDKAVETLRRSWSEAYGGENAHRTAVLPPGIKFTKVGATPEEGQYLQTREHQRVEIATIFNVPTHMVGTKDDGKSTVEQSSIEFLLFCLQAWIVAWEQELERKLFPKIGRSANKYFAKFDVQRLLYPDAESRSLFYGSGKQWGYLSTNDIHEREDMNPVEDGSGDIYWMPINMMNAAIGANIDPSDKGTPDGGAEPAPKKPAKKKREAAQYAAEYRVLFDDAFARATKRNKPTAPVLARIFSPALTIVGNAITEEVMARTTKEQWPNELSLEPFLAKYSTDLATRAAAWEGADENDISETETLAVIAAMASEIEGRFAQAA